MKSWKPARILYLILAVMLTFSVIPFIPFSINMTLAAEPGLTVFEILFFLYDAIGLLIALTILTRARRDHYKPTGAFLGLMTYALALLGHFLFYRYGQETLYFSLFFQAPVAEQLFRIIVLLAVITWLFNVLALVMCYLEVFGIRRTARSAKRGVASSHKIETVESQTDDVSAERAQKAQDSMEQTGHAHKVRKVADYKNIDPQSHLSRESAVSHVYEKVDPDKTEQRAEVKVVGERVHRGQKDQADKTQKMSIDEVVVVGAEEPTHKTHDTAEKRTTTDDAAKVDHQNLESPAKRSVKEEEEKASASTKAPRGRIVVKKNKDQNDGSINIVIEGVDLSQIKTTEDGIAIDTTNEVHKTRRSRKKPTANAGKHQDSDHTEDEKANGRRNNYVAQLTSDLLIKDTRTKENKSDAQMEVKSSHTTRRSRKQTSEQKTGEVEVITADMLDDFDDEA